MNLTPNILDEEGKEILFARVASKLLQDGKIDQATLVSEVGIKKYPDYAQGHYILAKCYQEKDMNEEARAEFERVLRYDAMHLGALKKLAGLYSATGLKDVYKDYLYRLITLDPLNTNILEECREQGVYDLWKARGESIVSTSDESAPSASDDDIGFSIEEEKKSVEEEAESEKKETEDLLKIDLNQFENQQDDFTTIMDGLIKDTSDDGQDADALNYLNDLQVPPETESELLAEEKPIEDSIDELDAFEKEEMLSDDKSSYVELDYGDKQEEQNIEENEEEPEDILQLDDSANIDDVKDEFTQASQDEEKEFDLPDLKLDEETDSTEVEENDAHDKTELVFEESDENVELEFEEPEPEEVQAEEKAIDEEVVINEVLPESNLEIEVDEQNNEKESDEDSPYVKQKIVSQTLGEILVSQNKYKEAKQVFLVLKKQQPDNPNIDKKLEILDKIIALEDKN